MDQAYFISNIVDIDNISESRKNFCMISSSAQNNYKFPQTEIL